MSPGNLKAAKKASDLFLVIVYLILSLSTVNAQHSVAKPGENEAYRGALKIDDPLKRIEAMEKFTTDFPESVFAPEFKNRILDSLIEVMPGQKERIFAQSSKIIDATPDAVKSGAYNSIAGKYLAAGILLDEALALSNKSLALLDEQKYFDYQKKSYEESNKNKLPDERSPAPTNEDLGRNFRNLRAACLSTLGRIHLKKGNQTEGEKILRESYAINPNSAPTAAVLAELAEKSGDKKAAVEYLSTSALTGRMKAEDRRRFESLYRQIHNNSLDGLNEMLDAKYKKNLPNPLKIEPYNPSSARTNRVVLGEVFTGSGCPSCVAADLAFEGVLGRYQAKDVAILLYHVNIPLPDPMVNPSTLARAKFYGIEGAPTYGIDGTGRDLRGGARSATQAIYDRLNSVIEKRLEAPAEAKIELSYTTSGTAIAVKAVVSNVKSPSGSLKLQIALVEKELTYSGENGLRFHPMVVRSLAGPNAGGFAVDAAASTYIEHTFDLAKISAENKTYIDAFIARSPEVNPQKLEAVFYESKHEMNVPNLSLVAFVQDENSKKILQAVHLSRLVF